MNLASSHLYQEHWELARDIIYKEAGSADVLRSPKLRHKPSITLETAFKSLDLLSLKGIEADYIRALQGNKKQALEILRGLSSID